MTRPPHPERRPDAPRGAWRSRWRKAWPGRSPARWGVLATYAWLVAMAFLQRPGQTTFDTKFDLTADVQRFLVESLSLWKQDSNFGELQNQAYGYLFPQGTFFLLGESLGIADWVVQRLWTALLLVVAFEGARRLWLALRPDGVTVDGLGGRCGLRRLSAPARPGGRAERGGAPDGRAAMGGAAARDGAARPDRAAGGRPVVGGGPVVHRRGQRRREPRGPAVAAVRGARRPRPTREADAWSAGGWVPSRWRAPGGCCPCSSSVGTARRSWTTSRPRRPWCARSGGRTWRVERTTGCPSSSWAGTRGGRGPTSCPPTRC